MHEAGSRGWMGGHPPSWRMGCSGRGSRGILRCSGGDQRMRGWAHVGHLCAGASAGRVAARCHAGRTWRGCRVSLGTPPSNVPVAFLSQKSCRLLHLRPRRPRCQLQHQVPSRCRRRRPRRHCRRLRQSRPAPCCSPRRRLLLLPRHRLRSCRAPWLCPRCRQRPLQGGGKEKKKKKRR